MQVIPITNSCGIFQWLTDTLTLKAFLETDSEYLSSSIAYITYKVSIQVDEELHEFSFYLALKKRSIKYGNRKV
jgi:hypothetical protein